MQVTELQKFVRNVKFVYQTRGLTQEEVAEEAGITEVHFCRILGEQVPNVSLKICMAISRAIGVAFTDLFLDIGEFMLKYEEKYSEKAAA